MIKLIIFDIGGVFRDSSKALNEGYKKGFESVGLPYHFKPRDTWHLRGLERYNNSINCIKALLALQRSKRSLAEILTHENAERILDELISTHQKASDDANTSAIYRVYRGFTDSEEAKSFIKVNQDAVDVTESLKRSGYTLAIFTNASMVTINRDLEYIGLEKFSAIIDENMVSHKKPSGEGIVKVMKMLHARKEDTYYVGDAASDAAAARDAGCKFIAVLSGMGLKVHMEKANPDFIFTNLTEMSDYLVSLRAAK